MMRLFKVSGTNNSVEEVTQETFKLERDIQTLIESNIDTFFNLRLVQSELSVNKYRIDTLCFNEETNSFVIIEYKKGNSYSVIDQGYTYLQLLLNNKSDFLLVLSHYFNKVLKFDDVDWSQSKIIFISPSYNSFQKDSVNFKDLPFELWEIKQYSNKTIVLSQHRSTSKESIDSISLAPSSTINFVNKEIQVTKSVEDHLSKTSPDIVEKWNELTEKLNELESIEIIPKNPYISVMYNGKNLAIFRFRKNSIRVEFLRGNQNPDGSKSKGYFTVDDPKGITTEGSWEWKSGTKGTLYKIDLDKNTDLNYFLFLLKQKYNQLT
jgi:hypothetical protein